MNRAVWTLLLPTTCAVFPWFLMRYADHDPVTNRVSVTTQILYVAVPAAGVLSVLAWGLGARELRRLQPLLPYVVTWTAYCLGELVTWLNYDRYDVLEGTTEWFGAMETTTNLLLWLIQPICAVVGGLLYLRDLSRAP